MRWRETTLEVPIEHVAVAHSELAQVQCCTASGRWNTGLQQGFGSSHHTEGSFGGAQWQPVSPFSPWRGEICCSMGNPWLSHQARTGQGVLGGTALHQSHQECLRGGWKCSMGLPTENCNTGSCCWKMSRSSNKTRSEDRHGAWTRLGSQILEPVRGPQSQNSAGFAT